MSKLLLRADAGLQIGTGHVMRCFALAQAWQARCGSAVFVMSGGVPLLEERILSEGMEVVILDTEPGSSADADRTAHCASQGHAQWIVIDGYHFTYLYQDRIRQSGYRVLCLDDNGEGKRYCADIVLNQNVHASESFYSDRQPWTKILAGARYALLRSEFSRWCAWKRTIASQATRILVALGGSDRRNLTLAVLSALNRFGKVDFEVRVVVGAGNPNLNELQRAAETSTLNIRLVSNVQDMSELMAWADFAIAAAGTTTLELAAMATPALLLIVADNQLQSAECMRKAEAARVLDCRNEVNSDIIGEEILTLATDVHLRKQLSERIHDFVDSNGAYRVLAEMTTDLSRRHSN